MPNLTDLTGLAGVAGAMTASLLLLPPIRRLAGRRRAWAIGAGLAIALTPFNGFPPAAYVRGVTGDLSITTLILLGCALMGPRAGCARRDSAQRLALAALIALAALLLYPMALGIGTFDPYRLGYGSWPFITVLLLVSLAAWFRKNHPVALCVSLAVFAWSIGWHESSNLWDYLLDPFVAIYALAALVFSRFPIHLQEMIKPPR